MDKASVLIKPEAAQQQLDREAEANKPVITSTSVIASTLEGFNYSTNQDAGNTVAGTSSGLDINVRELPDKPKSKRFHGNVTLDSTRVVRDVGVIAQEVIAHLTPLLGANVEVTLEVTVNVPEGVPEDVVRTVTENCRTLKFNNHGFESE